MTYIVIIGLLLLIVCLLGGGNIIAGAIAFPLLGASAIYYFGMNGFIGVVIFIFLIPAFPLIFGLLGVSVSSGLTLRRHGKMEEKPLELGKYCERCDRTVMNGAPRCPECKGKLVRLPVR